MKWGPAISRDDGRPCVSRTHVLDLLIIAIPMLRPLRVLRAVRLVRLGALVGIAHTRAERSLHVRVATYAVTTILVLLAVAAAAMNDAEREAENGNIKGFGDALWWAATTVTTVGYGDRYPTTVGGRLVAVALMVAGIALLGVVTATIATWFVDRLRRVQEAEQATKATLADVLSELREIRQGLERIERRTASPQ
jgi:voltage-gated potassium channel